MRRATTFVPTRDAEASGSRRQDRQEERIRALEEAFAREQQRRDELEKKYTRLKRRYLRLEMAHALLQATSKQSPGSATRTRQLHGTPESSPLSLHGRNSPPSPDQDEDKAAVANASVIDLTSPTGSRRTSLATDGASMRNSQQAMSSDDFCAESPASPAVSAAFSNGSRRVARVLTRRPNSDPLPPPPPPPLPSNGPPGASGSRRRQLEFYTPDPSSRPRPRPLSNPSSPDEASESMRSSTRRRTRSPETSPPALAARTERSTPSTAQSTTTTAAAASVASTDDSDEAASIALAQYLQQQENLAALQEYQEHLQARELAQELERQQHQHQQHEHHAAGGGGVDPDNMTYEELLQLGEDNGDVKKERWRQVAVQVLSSLPTHRWTTQSSDDISCIICQYGFSVGDVALTLPCAHVFHEECVTGWVRENNSCPLCKLAIADV